MRQLPRSIRASIFVLCMTLVGITIVVAITTAAEPADKPAGKPVADAAKPLRQPRPKLTLSREVTFITEPLAADGLVDYAAALNAKYGKGVTPENNAAVAIPRALGPQNFGEDENSAAICKRLGIAALPAKGDYFVAIDPFVQDLQEQFHRDATTAAKRVGITRDALRLLLEQHTDWSDTLERCEKIPWSAKDEPIVTAWLKHNEAALKTLTSGSERARFFVPHNTGKGTDGLLDTMNITIRAMPLFRALSIRVMQHVAAGNAQPAWADTLALRRWAAHAEQGGMVIDHMIALAIRRMASASAVCVITINGLSEAELVEMHKQWNAIAAPAGLGHAFAIGERCFLLEGLNSVVRGAEPTIAGDSFSVSVRLQKFRRTPATRILTSAATNWNAAYRGLNSVYDELDRAMHLPTFKERIAAARKLEARYERLARPANLWVMLLTIAALDPPAARTALGQLLSTSISSDVIPAMVSMIETDQMRSTECDLLPVAYMLARYRSAHGEYPEHLDKLVPALAAKVPSDPFGDGPLKYERTKAGGFLLFSVGQNGKDDGGNSLDPFVETTRNRQQREAAIPEDSDADDLIIRIEGKHKS